MPKRRRLFTPIKYKIKSAPKQNIIQENEEKDLEVSSARGRFRGALKEVLEPTHSDNESDYSTDATPTKRERWHNSDEVRKAIRKSPPRQSYVLKLFDRSVDLSQFRDDSPLYPICRAWMANQPKADYNKIECSSLKKDAEVIAESVELPGPFGPPVSKVPELLPEQAAADKDNINLNYRDAPLPSREQLLRQHLPRWAAVKQAWQEQIMLKEARYEGTQHILNRINLEYPSR